MNLGNILAFLEAENEKLNPTPDEPIKTKLARLCLNYIEANKNKD